MTTRSELQVSVVALVVAVAYPRLAGGAVRISHSYHPASATVPGHEGEEGAPPPPPPPNCLFGHAGEAPPNTDGLLPHAGDAGGGCC